MVGANPSLTDAKWRNLAVRDSKNPSHGTLTLSRTAWGVFLPPVTK